MLLPRTAATVSKLAAEFIGTFAVVFAGCGAIMVADRFPGSVPAVAIPVVFGLTVAAMIYAMGHISGAHFNPAVTLAFAAARHIPLSQVIGYWIAQCLGALLASLLAAAMLPPGVTYGGTHPHMVSALQAITWEATLTFLLMLVIIAVATDTRAVGTMAGAAIGAIVAVGAFVGGPVTGASMNPARSIGPAVAEGNWGDLWIYIVGPAAGAITAAKLYEWIRCQSVREPGANSDQVGGGGGCC